MHSVIVVSDQASLEELNQLLADEGWWVDKISSGEEGSWLVVLTDRDPDKLFDDCGHDHSHEEFAEEELDQL